MSRITSFISLVFFTCNLIAQNELYTDTSFKGDIKSITQFSYNSDAPEEVYQITTLHFNKQNQPTKTYVGKLDENRLTREMIYDKNDLLVMEIHFRGQKDTTIIKTYQYGPFGVTRELTRRNGLFKPYGHNYKYSEEGLLIKDEKFKIYDGKEVEINREKIEYTYYPNGKPHKMISKRTTKEYHGDTITITDHTGGDKKEQVILNGQEQVIKKISYDDKGVVGGVMTEAEQEENTEVSRNINDQLPKKIAAADLVISSTTEYYYNDKNHTVKSVHTSKQPFFRVGKTFYEYNYDDKGNIISYKEFSKDGDVKKLRSYFTREISYYR